MGTGRRLRRLDFVARERQAGWVEALGEAGVTPVVMQVHDNVEPDVSEGARALLAGPDRPTAVLCFSDLMAAAVVHAAEDAGLRVPDDISVVGFDDSPLSRRLRPALTTVHQDFDAKGKAAAHALTSSIARFRAGTHPPRSSTGSSSTWWSATAPHPRRARERCRTGEHVLANGSGMRVAAADVGRRRYHATVPHSHAPDDP